MSDNGFYPHKQGDQIDWNSNVISVLPGLGLFNLETAPASITLKWSDLHITGNQSVRDLWRQKDLGKYFDSFSAQVNSHGVVLVKISPTP